MRYELKPRQNEQKSFYGKAVVYQDNRGNKTLYSYGVKIMSISPAGVKTRYWNGHIHDDGGDLGWSRTTGRHIKAFSGLNKAEYLSLPMRG